jgi:hypothetical protein
MDVGAHYHPIDADRDPGVYRVVGATDGVTLLRVGDADGRRVHTGEVRRVTASTLRTEFEPAADPDAGLSPAGTLRNAAQGLYWSVRRVLP